MNFLIIGLGSLGFRHLQALKSSYPKANFFFLDKQKKKILFDNLKNLDINFQEYLSNGTYIQNLTDVVGIQFDLVIVSTTADNRGKLLLNIQKKIAYKYILLEKPITNSCDDLNFFNKIDTKNIFVNHHRRYQELHQHIDGLKQRIKKIKFQSSNLGLLCNFSHHVDFARMLIGYKPEIISVSCNFKNFFESSRKSYYEVNGSLKIEFSNNTILEIENDEEKYSKDRIVKILTDTTKFYVNESKGELFKEKKLIKKASNRPQSKLTHIYFQDLQNNGCILPSLNSCLNDFQKIIPSLEKYFFKNFLLSKKKGIFT